MPAGEANDNELIGRLLGGRYRVTSVVGRGGMGVVARAVDELLGREVAVKILRAYTDAGAAELADLRTRMRREAQAAARIRHGGVVTVHDVTEEQGLPVIVMELVDGPSLDDVLTERGPLDPREAAAIGAALMEALDAAHRAGVLHRDVKPGNVLLERGGRVVLTDFGIATMDAAEEDAVSKLTRSGQIIGSLDYLPPERAQGHEPGPPSDIWSLGMTLYAAVEGTSAFRRTSAWSTLSAIVSEPLPEPRRAGPLAPVLRALMAKDPAGRPTAAQARAMLERVAADPAPPAPAPVSAPAPAPAPAPVAGGAFGPPPVVVPYAQPYEPPAHTAFPAPGQPSAAVGTDTGARYTGTTTATGRTRRRSLSVTAFAVLAVLGAGGLTYALTGGHGGRGAARAAMPGGPSTGQPGAVTGGANTPSASPSPTTTSKKKPSGTASPRRTPTSATAKPSPVPTSCGGWSHKDPTPGSYGFMAGDYHIETGPYETCPAVSLAKTGTKLRYYCYTVNAYGNKWTYVRVDGTTTSGWMSNDNLTGQKGPLSPC
ncbi:serine/threonine protein kinase [Streptomyces sp. NBC_00536]|uniref:serine/threonine-protein kinase n=1 Tax=Streptomyces sp. NBC_00536 TaxID=2975769 RepID=UPI002E805D8C|nr:serine/threonine-protein kinase [Streptomyces sp. NBC_00536]WUC82944.1 serine/threonine protein kinase [Streptomyces sp. NBC_00536]